MNQIKKTRLLVESAVMLALTVILSYLKIPWALGGSITVCSMLPLVFVAQRHGTKWGLFIAFIYSVIKLLLGIDNVQYATSFLMAVGIILLDYTLAFSSVGLSAVFNGVIRNRRASICAGICLGLGLRLFFHFLSGWMIWDALWPNELGYASAWYSLVYNGSYMLPEIAITIAAAMLLYKPLERYWLGEE